MNLTSRSRVLIQGIDVPQAADYVARMKAYGTNLVAGVSAGLGGESIEDLPVFDLVEDAINQQGTVEASLIFVHPYQVLDAAREALAAKIPRIILLTAEIPPLDLISLLKHQRGTNSLLLGPGSQGIIIPGKILLGTLNPQFYTQGNIGIISRSEYLSYEVALALNQKGLGQSIVVTIGSEPIVGSNFRDWLSLLVGDPDTKAIVLIGEPEEELKEVATYYRKSKGSKPIIVYLAGLQVPRTIIYRDANTIIANQLSYSVSQNNLDKQIMTALEKASIQVAKSPSEVSLLLEKALSTK